MSNDDCVVVGEALALAVYFHVGIVGVQISKRDPTIQSAAPTYSSRIDISP